MSLDPLQSDAVNRSHLEPELGGVFRQGTERSGLEPQLGGTLGQKGVYVDELICIGCKYCAHVATNTFYIEPNHGRSRVINQTGDPEALIQEAIDSCPVDCIQWVEYPELRALEADRKHQVIPVAGFPIDRGGLAAQRRRQSQG
ncbi:ferredoxin [Prochlorothrix hollandica]|uniref:Ferredoxin n=1 Tax=Prochlorothrix hollandica PCC 9006 = CALU 1027 TaxID=317619 RepID=A0A0M2PY85_PROHO|nr:ferredoxin [Prochlorothrix hollandica]KKJ00043.1 ferredoxin [Prochlorothrix hollandica PCC 9006 = CALU 1027]